MLVATAVKLRAGLTQLPLTLQWKQSDASYSPLAPAKGAIKYLGILNGPSFYSWVDKETSPFSLVGKRHVKDLEISPARASSSRRDKTWTTILRGDSAFRINSNIS